VIRPATAADGDAVRRLLVRQLRAHRIRVPAARLARPVGGVLRHPERGRILLAIVGGKAVGLAALSFMWPLSHFDPEAAVPPLASQALLRASACQPS